MGSLSLNNTGISRMFLGNSEVSSAYFGSTLVYNKRNFNVKFYNINGNLLSSQTVGKGQSATAPTFTIYDSAYVEFDKWTQDFSDVQCDLEIGAVPKTVDGKTYIVATLSGSLNVTINIFKDTTDTTTISWGNGGGSNTTTTTSGYVSLTKTYTSGGEKGITITTDNNGGVALGNAAGSVFITVSSGTLSNMRVYSGIGVRYLAGAFYNSSTKQPFILGVNNTYNSSETNLFRNSNITTMTFGNAGNTITASAFRDCVSLSKVFFGEGLTTLGSSSFDRNIMESIVLPISLNSMNLFVFGRCANLKKVILRSPIPPTLQTPSAGVDIFNGTHADLKIYVPDHLVQTYKITANWDFYASKIFGFSDLP